MLPGLLQIKSKKKLSKNYRKMTNGAYGICRKAAYFNAAAHRNMAMTSMEHEITEHQWRSIALFHIYNSIEMNPESKRYIVLVPYNEEIFEKIDFL